MVAGGKYFLYEQVFLTLKGEILQGLYDQGSCLPSEREIAQRFHVDRATVRKAMDLLVGESLVEKRAGSCSKVLYQGKDTGLLQKHAGTMIGFFIIEDSGTNRIITQPFYSDLFYEVEQQCKRYGMDVLYATIKSMKEYASLLQQLSYVIIAGKSSPEYFRLAEKHQVRALHVHGYNGVSPSITYDSFNSGILMSEYLITHGHHDIALITGRSNFPTSQNRLAGVLLTMFRHQLSISPEWILEGNWEYESGYQMATKLFRSVGKHPTAIYAFNDIMALGAMQAIKDLGLSIPADVSIVGGDNIRELESSGVKLTTTNANINRMAVSAIQLFLHTPEDAGGLQIMVPVSLIEGDTVRNLRYRPMQRIYHTPSSHHSK